MTFSITNIGQAAKAAARRLLTASTDKKNETLRVAAKALREQTPAILDANAKDITAAEAAGRPASFLDRLKLTEDRIAGMADALVQIADLPDPVGRQLDATERPNGLNIERIAVPIGVIGMVYESRPNVGADASALALKSGNAIILRGGSESLQSSRRIVACMQEGLRAAGLPEQAVQMIDTPDRSAVAALLQCSEYVDLVIPRGGRGLVELVRDQAKVPTLLHLDGNCHVYIHEAADLSKAAAVVRNAKLRRTGVCGAAESLVIDRNILPDVLPLLVDVLAGCELRGDGAVCALDASITGATEGDWGQEYLDTIISIKSVAGIDQAIAHVQTYSSGHTDAIITENIDAAHRFIGEIDSAIVMHNASTQFADGGEFGMGAEIGIATGRLHARGPVGLEQLTTYKYVVRGTGQIRPR